MPCTINRCGQAFNWSMAGIDGFVRQRNTGQRLVSPSRPLYNAKCTLYISLGVASLTATFSIVLVTKLNHTNIFPSLGRPERDQQLIKVHPPPFVTQRNFIMACYNTRPRSAWSILRHLLLFSLSFSFLARMPVHLVVLPRRNDPSAPSAPTPPSSLYLSPQNLSLRTLVLPLGYARAHLYHTHPHVLHDAADPLNLMPVIPGLDGRAGCPPV